MQSQGHGDVLTQAGADPTATAAGGGGLFGSLVQAVEGAFGGAQGADMQSGIGALVNMFAPGVPVSAGHQQALNEILPR